MDNDIIIKLAALNLIPEALGVIGTAQLDVFGLDTFKPFLVGNKTKLIAQWTAAGYNRAVSFAANISTLPGHPDARDFSDLAIVDSIDDGEALLFECGCRYPNSIIATGDKRSLKALANESGCKSIYDRISGRVICFEQVLHRLAATYGYDLVRDRCCPMCNSDIGLGQIFFRGEQTLQIEANTKLRDALQEISSATGALLVPTSLEIKTDKSG